MANKLLNEYFYDKDGNEKLILTHSVDRTADTTDKPVEDGVIITDHIMVKPLTISIQFELFDEFTQQGEIIHNYGVPISNNTQKKLSKLAIEKLDNIVALQYNKELVNYVDTQNNTLYENFVITSIKTSTSKDMINGIGGTLDLKQINKTISRTTYELGTWSEKVDIPQDTGINDKGTLKPKDDKSIIKRAIDSFTGAAEDLKEYLLNYFKQKPVP